MNKEHLLKLLSWGSWRSGFILFYFSKGLFFFLKMDAHAQSGRQDTEGQMTLILTRIVPALLASLFHSISESIREENITHLRKDLHLNVFSKYAFLSGFGPASLTP